MGSNMVQRLLKNDHEAIVWDPSEETVELVVEKGAEGVESLEDMVEKLPSPKIIWLMVPSGDPVDENLDELLSLLQKDDIIVDGGNSYYKDSQKRAERATEKGVYFLDCGTSGGVWGLENGYCLMYGGKEEAVEQVTPIFKSLAPDDGHVYCGPSGTGHMVKMVHNGIEYGIMQSYAEGFEILERAPYDLNLTEIADAWQYGSVIRSWLLELTVLALQEDPSLEKIKDYVDDSGEGRWTVQTAIEFDAPANVIAASLFARFQSRQKNSFAMKMLAAMRNQFGGHDTKSSE